MLVRSLFIRCNSAVMLVVLTLASSHAMAAESNEAGTLAERLDEILDSHPTAKRTTVTLKVVDLASGETIYDRDGDRLQVPASNLKIYTSACALDAFGPDHRFKTIVRADGAIVDDILLGDLRLVGGGDAMLTTGDLRKLAQRVVKVLGVRQIAGKVVVDNSRYAPELKGPGWMWDDEPFYYNMSVTPLMVDFNVLTVKLTPDAEGFVSAKLNPPSDYPKLISVDANSAAASGELAMRRPFVEKIDFLGDRRIEKPVDVRMTMHDPGPWAAGLLTQMLADEGVNFSPPKGARRAAVADERSAAVEIVQEGPTLAETLKHFNHVSENAIGEVLLHEIAIANGVKQPNWPDGAKVIGDWLVAKAKLEPGSFRMVDGSGLSRYNLISADSATRLLASMHDSDNYEPFFKSLPTSEIEFDVAQDEHVGDGSSDAPVSAKGGSMSSVSTISGYIRTNDGRTLAFSLLANGFIGSNKPIFDLRQQVWRELVK